MTVLLLVTGTALAQELEFPNENPSADLALGKCYEGVSKAKRPYWYRLPEKIDKDAPPDLIFLLHGTGLSYKWGFWNYAPHKGHFRKNDIVVSPESEMPGRGFMQKKPDREEIANLIKLFKKTFPVRNVYLYGHSQGAFFCYYFAGERPEMIDGIVAHAGNFFKAKTNKAARDKVAIGILHGKADAVVTVECAFMTDIIYRTAGYKKIKLWPVDGLNKQSGHWPLPWHVQRMLAWCDMVSIKTPKDGEALIKSELALEKPDYVLAAQAAVRARNLGAKNMDAIVEAAQANAEALTKADTSAYGPWVAHLRSASRAFAGLPEWEEAIKPLQSLVKKHTKQAESGIKSMRKNSKKSFAGGLKAMDKGYAGVGYDNLLAHMENRFTKPGDNVSQKDLDRYNDLDKSRKAADKKGRQAFADLTRPKLESLK
jgi:predicted esterase